MLEVKNITKSYRGRQVLPSVSFCLPAGQCLGITGENGSGKSTLLRIIAQVEKPDAGDILFSGNSIRNHRAFFRKQVGYVPQHSELMPDLTVREQLKLWQSACGLSGSISENLMDLLDLQPMLKARTQELSGGMQKRVSIAMALMNDPKILIMDEVTAGLDRDYTARLLTFAEEFLARGGRILWCSHQTEEIQQLCGGILRLDE